jgi:hypothetical protein
MRFNGPAAYIADRDRSCAFYEGLPGFTAWQVMSRGEIPLAVAYTERLSIWLASAAYAALFGDASLAPQDLRSGNWEDTFEPERYEEIYGQCVPPGPCTSRARCPGGNGESASTIRGRDS